MLQNTEFEQLKLQIFKTMQYAWHELLRILFINQIKLLSWQGGRNKFHNGVADSR